MSTKAAAGCRLRWEMVPSILPPECLVPGTVQQFEAPMIRSILLFRKAKIKEYGLGPLIFNFNNTCYI